MLTLNDVIVGNTYYVEYSTNLGDYTIINCDKNYSFSSNLGGIHIKNKRYYKNNSWSCKNNIRLATDEEKAWLQHCIKEDKFVEYEEFMKVYKPQFIVGQWYKYNNHIGKFYSYDNGIFQVSEYIYKKRYFNSNSNWGSKDKDTERSLATIEEFQEFLPLDHPDKQLDIKQIQEECKKRFPIGCKFRCASTDNKNTLEQTSSTYNILGIDAIDAGILKGFLYYGGKYAELIEAPEVISPEYVECVIEDSCIEVGKIYQVDKNLGFKYADDIKPVYYLVENYRTPYYQSHFRPSTKLAYNLQNLKQQPLTSEQCYNTEIEVGDEVWSNTPNYKKSNLGGNDGFFGTLLKISGTSDRYRVSVDNRIYDYGDSSDKETNYVWCESVKLIKKANKNTTTTTLNKKVDVSSPKVTDRLRLKVRNQTTVVNNEERIKLKLNHLKTIKIKQNGN